MVKNDLYFLIIQGTILLELSILEHYIVQVSEFVIFFLTVLWVIYCFTKGDDSLVPSMEPLEFINYNAGYENIACNVLSLFSDYISFLNIAYTTELLHTVMY